jgi:glyoxylase-like metal-dependent hydrolase (beta-lactamase superfamily II)
MARELAMIQQVWWRDEGQREEFSALSRCAGVGDEMLASFLHISAEIRAHTRPHVTQVETLRDGEMLRIGARTFRVIEAPGHSVGQALLYDATDALLLSADHVLLKITPNVGVWPGSDDDPLARFIESLTTLRALDVRLALPGHKDLIRDWRGRIDELLYHHEERLGYIRAAAQDATALEVALAIFPFERFSPHEQRFAVAEALAHLEHLRLRGDLRRADVDGVWRYR